MSLLTWLPLNGSTNNQGISNVGVASYSMSNLNRTEGKLGKCLYFNGNNNYLELEKYGINLFCGDFSYAFWVKPTDTTRSILISDYSGDGASNIGFEILPTDSHLYLRMYWNGAPDIKTTAELTLNEWNHVILIKTTDKIRFYINGVLSYTYTGTLLDRTSNVGLRIGDDYRGGSSVSFQGYLNDIRIYNHALSQKEIKLLSQTLIVHYLLNRQSSGNDNLIDGTSWKVAEYTYPESGFLDKFGSVTNEPVTESKYILSFWAKSTVAGDKVRAHFYNPNTTTVCTSSQGLVRRNISDGNIDITLSTEWEKYWIIYEQSETTTTKNVIFPRMFAQSYGTGGEATGTGVVSIRGVKFEVGDKPTPWTPTSWKSYQVASSTTEYDVAGYKKKLSVMGGSFTYNSDCPRYTLSTHFDGAAYFLANDYCDTYFPVDAITISVRFKVTTWGTLISCTEGGGWNIESNGTYIQFPVFITGMSDYVRTVSDKTPSYFIDGNWHMITGTCDCKTNTTKIYIDGELNNTNTYVCSGENKIGYVNNKLVIGGEAAGGTGTASYGIPGFVGDMCDVRIYATALSAEDIKELYNTSANIDNNGNCYVYEYEEI